MPIVSSDPVRREVVILAEIGRLKGRQHDILRRLSHLADQADRAWTRPAAGRYGACTDEANALEDEYAELVGALAPLRRQLASLQAVAR